MDAYITLFDAKCLMYNKSMKEIQKTNIGSDK